MSNMKATQVTRVTSLGTNPAAPLPRSHGNRFSVSASDGRAYRITNFVHENLEALLARGLTWPISIRKVNDTTAVIEDDRIPSDWYMQPA